MESSDITVIVPTFNEGENIYSLINSLLNQTLRPFEIIISDGGSKDSTVQIVKKFIEKGEPIRIVNRKGKCRGAGRNSGINASSTQLICLIDAGITPEKNWIQKLSETYYSNQCQVVYGMVKPIADSFVTRSLGAIIVGKSGKEGYLFPSVASMLMKKSSWNKVGKFKEDKKGRYVVEDLDFIKKIENQGLNCIYSNEAIVNWSIPSKYRDIFLRFSTYSEGTLRASMYKIWHFGLLRNVVIYSCLISLSIEVHIMFNVFLIIFHAARAFSYLRRVPWFMKARIEQKIMDFLQTFILLILIDIASIKGVFDWLKNSIRESS